MNNIPENYQYTKDHEWLLAEDQMTVAEDQMTVAEDQMTVAEDQMTVGKRYRVGITDFAQAQLGDLVFVDLPKIGAVIEAGKSFCVVESTKAASDVYAPLNGKIIEVNAQLSSSPELINQDPYHAGWIAVIEIEAGENLTDFLSANQYSKHLSQ
jgi:glycine cleavage system H protein